MSDLVIGVDLGGTQVRAALCDSGGRLLTRAANPAHGAQGPEAVFAQIVETIRQVAGDWAGVRRIGLCAPSPVDPRRGIVLEPPNLPGMVNFPMKERLENEFHLPAFVGNDANLAGLAEQRYGAGRGVAHMLYMTISTGIGGGIIADGQLFLGWRGLAGEVGHQTLEAHGPLCNCGNIGCLEVLAAGPAIARDARDALHSGRSSMLRELAGGDLDQVTTALVVQGAREGDALAREILDRAGFYIGLGIVNLLHIVDTQLFVLGGGVAIHAWDFLYPQMVRVLDEHAFPSMRKGVSIVPAQLGDDAGLLGAAVLAMDPMSG
jgi:glucokinase